MKGRLLALLVALAGCLAPAAQEAAAPTPVALAAFGGAVPAGEALRWDGARLHAEGADGCDAPTCWVRDFAACWTEACPRPACGERNCERVPFEVRAQDGPSRLVVAVQTPQDWSVNVVVDVLDSAGNVAARGRSGWFAAVAVLDDPAPGAYEAVVVARRGEGVYEGAVRVDALDPVARDLLPNLVTLPPRDLRIESPEGPLGDALAAAGRTACRADEALEQGAVRCLRFGNAVGNAGDGPLEVRLAVEQGAGALAGRGRFVQRVASSDGSFEDVPVGPAEYHATHGHFHYAGLAAYTLHRFDLETGTRGEAVADGRKAGFCFLDSGLVGLGLPATGAPAFDGRGCVDPLGVDPTQAEGWFMGMSAKWFDLYDWQLPDQYVDVSGVEDGVYELVSEANAQLTLLETDPTDNWGSVVFRLQGDTVEVLDERRGWSG